LHINKHMLIFTEQLKHKTYNDEKFTRYGEAKKQAIINALEDSYTEGIYLTSNGKIKRQLLNGTSQILDSNNSF